MFARLLVVKIVQEEIIKLSSLDLSMVVLLLAVPIHNAPLPSTHSPTDTVTSRTHFTNSQHSQTLIASTAAQVQRTLVQKSAQQPAVPIVQEEIVSLVIEFRFSPKYDCDN